jgi:hypothetical protein
MKVLALSFLMMIGVVLVADGLGQHINKGYLFRDGVLAVVELNIRTRKQAEAGSGSVVMTLSRSPPALPGGTRPPVCRRRPSQNAAARGRITVTDTATTPELST